jgi:hypothetical protein
MRSPRTSILTCLLLVACGSPSSPSKPAMSNSGNGTGGMVASVGGSGAAGSGTVKSVSAGSGGAAPVVGGSGGVAAAVAGRPAVPGSGQDAGPASGGTSGSAAAGSGDSGTSAAPTTGLFPAVTDFVGDGPFTPTTLDNTGPSGNYTVYLPQEPPPQGAKNPIVGWMSGGSTVPSGYTLLPHLASHGFVVVASNTAPGIGDEVNLGKEIIAGIDWAIAENARQGSQLFGRLDTTKIASMGYSMGSLATFTIADDPRLTTTVHISGGNMAPERINNLHAPAAFLCGIPGDDTCNILSTDCDIAAANCDTDFANAKTPVFYANFPGGHLGILTPPNQDIIQAEATAWLRWQLMGDSTLKSRFVGDQCTVCKDSNWKKVQQKNLP